MKKVKKIFKNNYKILIGLILGVIISVGGVYAAATISGSTVSYSNTTSGLSSTTVQDAIDELYNKTDIRKMSNFVAAYKYSTEEATKCITGEEDTCEKSVCYKVKTRNCPTGTIIKYKVNDTDIVTFHVMYDSGPTLTMQSQKNIINNTNWISASDYEAYNADSTSCSYDSCHDEGPMTVLVALERITNSWTNVNNQTYKMGTTIFETNAYTGCSNYNSCTTNTYTLASRTSKARMITVQEAADLGCTTTQKSCPIWLYNYLYNSKDYGGTVNDNSRDSETNLDNYGYWTMSASRSGAWSVNYSGYMISHKTYDNLNGARAVVEVSK